MFSVIFSFSYLKWVTNIVYNVAVDTLSWITQFVISSLGIESIARGAATLVLQAALNDLTVFPHAAVAAEDELAQSATKSINSARTL